MNKKVFAIIIDNERLSLYSKNINFFLGDVKKYVPEGVKIYLIDISNLHIIKKKITKINMENIEFNYFIPKNLKELYHFSNNNKILATVKIRENFRNLRLNFLLNFINFKRIIINVDGFFLVADKTKNFSFFEKINVFINIKLSYYFYRVLSILGMVKKVDVYITASQINIDKIKSGISSRIKNIIPINLSYMKKIYRVNSHLDENQFKKDLPEEFIVFCDSGFDHGDRVLRDGVIQNEQRESYYKRIHELLSHLESLYKKKAIFCQHPKSDYPHSENFEKIKKCFKVIKYETDKYIAHSYLSIFLSSMSIGYAISLKKKIILVKSELLGNFYSLRSDILRKTIELFEIDIDSEEYKKIDEEYLNSQLIHKLTGYDKFIGDNLIKDKSDNHSNQIKKIVYKEFL